MSLSKNEIVHNLESAIAVCRAFDQVKDLDTAKSFVSGLILPRLVPVLESMQSVSTPTLVTSPVEGKQ